MSADNQLELVRAHAMHTDFIDHTTSQQPSVIEAPHDFRNQSSLPLYIDGPGRILGNSIIVHKYGASSTR
ncbi:hypothetical protein J6590_026224 [Homalodisca vitripennis]|nr:hypothetical protein J6590_026224 [Homalodisca vitripennis]